MGGTQNTYADYDYNEAKRAAVTCRRIEYSYNLRNVIKSEICLDEVIMIQRWWRNILRRKNEELLKDLKIIEKININNIQRYILFLNKIHYVYVLHLLNDFYNKFAKLNTDERQKMRENILEDKTRVENILLKIKNNNLMKGIKDETNTKRKKVSEDIKNYGKQINSIRDEILQNIKEQESMEHEYII